MRPLARAETPQGVVDATSPKQPTTMNLDLLIIVGTTYVGNALIFGWLQALPYTITIVAASAAIWFVLVLGCIL